jgi:hypothetical protein
MSAFHRILFGAALALLLLPATACIRSRVIIESEPPGATVKFHREVRGETPITIPFIWYWYYEVELEKEGYEPLRTVERFRTPPWFIFPLDGIMELMPFPITDTRKRTYQLKPLAKPTETPANQPTGAPAEPGNTAPPATPTAPTAPAAEAAPTPVK